MPPRAATVGALLRKARKELLEQADLAVAMHFQQTDVGKALDWWVTTLTAPVTFHTFAAVMVDIGHQRLGSEYQDGQVFALQMPSLKPIRSGLGRPPT